MPRQINRSEVDFSQLPYLGKYPEDTTPPKSAIFSAVMNRMSYKKASIATANSINCCEKNRRFLWNSTSGYLPEKSAGRALANSLPTVRSQEIDTTRSSKHEHIAMRHFINNGRLVRYK